MNRVIVHIGAPKCGSTYLQRVLLKNKKSLANKGIYYPHLGPGHPGNGSTIDHITQPWLTQKFREFHTIVFSHEDLFALPKKGLRLHHLSRTMGFQFQIVAFFRAFPDVLFADYSQTLRQNFETFCQIKTAFDGRSFHDFARHRRTKIMPAIFLRDWQKLSPRKPLMLNHPEKIKSCFIGLLGDVPGVDWDVPSWRCNPSIPLSTCLDIAQDINSGRINSARTKMKTPKRWNHIPRLDERAFVQQLFQPESANLKTKFGFNA